MSALAQPPLSVWTNHKTRKIRCEQIVCVRYKSSLFKSSQVKFIRFVFDVFTYCNLIKEEASQTSIVLIIINYMSVLMSWFWFKIVSTSTECIFALSAIAIPGGTLEHGQKEINECSKHFGTDMDYIVIALGTNDVLRPTKIFDRNFKRDVQNVIATCRQVYPHSKVS